MDAWLVIMIAAFVVLDAAITVFFVKHVKAKSRARLEAETATHRPGGTSTDAATVARDMGLGS